MMFVCSMTMFVLHMTMFVFMYDDVCLHYVYKWFGKVWLGLARLGRTRPLSVAHHPSNERAVDLSASDTHSLCLCI